jgi:guanylate kinase
MATLNPAAAEAAATAASNSSSSSTSSSASSHYRPLCICGPSGVGKGTLLNRLFADFPSVFGKKVSHTTRAPRAGEVEGASYYFVSKEEFERGIAAGEFIEYAYVHGNIYGTSVESVRRIADSGRVCVLELDVQGAEAILKTTLNAFFFFILPPSFDSLKERLIGRGSESDDTIAVRLDTAKKELQFAERRSDIFHVKIVNDDLDRAYRQLKDEIKKCYPRIPQLQ